MAGKLKLTEAQKRILIDARDKGDVLANGPRKRPCAMLVHMGLLEKRKGRARVLTDAGEMALAELEGEGHAGDRRDD